MLVSLRVCHIGLGGNFVPDPTPFAVAAAVLAALLAGASVKFCVCQMTAGTTSDKNGRKTKK
eukprot:COSAG06_NODE_56430_length_284_cov_2.600000_1_plen_61_part_01